MNENSSDANGQMERRFVNPRLPALWHGGDYNPEQWPQETLEEDLDLMDRACCDVFSVGIFAWAAIEPEEGKFEFGWLDQVLNRFAERGKYVALATPSAVMPAWLAKKHPDILRVGADGVRNRFGNRVNFCGSSPEYKKRCRNVAERLAIRYGKHPALVLWHVSNEYFGECRCERCEAEFRAWLQRKFEGNLDGLNRAYWTAFWSHTFSDWDQIEIPGPPHGDESMVGLALDWRRFVTHQVVEFFENEAEPLRRHSSAPITTNLMGTYPGIDYWRLAGHLDVIAWDSYPAFSDGPMRIEDWIYTAFRHDLNRSLKRKPFLMIESTPSSSNWYPAMALKRPNEHRMEALQAIAHGSDAVMYFQWRQSRGGKEKFHGAVVQHDGSSTARVFGEVAALGRELVELQGVAGTATCSKAAVIYDWENAWAIDLAGGPRRGRMDYLGACLQEYGALWSLAVPTDVIESTATFDPYKLIVAPMLFMVKPGVAERLRSFVSGGGTLVLTYHSGMVDENDLCFQGGFPGPLRELCGIWVEEIDALHDGATNQARFDPGNDIGIEGSFEARELCEIVQAQGADVLASYASDFYAGRPALTRNRVGAGEVYYVASRNEPEFSRGLLDSLVDRIGLERDAVHTLPKGVFARRRHAPEGEFLFLINFNAQATEVELSEPGFRDATSDIPLTGKLELGAREAIVAFRPTKTHRSATELDLTEAR